MTQVSFIFWTEVLIYRLRTDSKFPKKNKWRPGHVNQQVKSRLFTSTIKEKQILQSSLDEIQTNVLADILCKIPDHKLDAQVFCC